MSAPRFRLPAVLAAIALVLAPARADDPYVTYEDDASDAALRRTDPGDDGALHPSGVLPEIVSLTIGAWASPTPSTDPYSGDWIDDDDDDAELFRLDLVVGGLVNPPGTLGVGGHPFNPFAYGPSPVVGFVELDIDRDEDTGGECGDPAKQRYLANIGRFGATPYGSLSSRMARDDGDLDGSFGSSPQFERSGQDFSLVFCGCFPVTVVNRFGDTSPATFGAGETWIVQGRFFQRAGGYQAASAMYGGSAPGMYDPIVRIRFRHDAQTDQTTISLVYALTMEGAGLLAGQPTQAANLNVNDQTSIIEALEDIIIGAEGPLSGCAYYLTRRWEGEDASQHLDPTNWEPLVLLGMPYSSAGAGSLYAWTDVGMDETFGDCDGSGLIDGMDEMYFADALADRDGGPTDADGVVNGVVVIPSFSQGFSLYDFDYSGVIDGADMAVVMPGLPGDLTGDCVVNFEDLNLVISYFNSTNSAGDANGDNLVNFEDLNLVLSNFNVRCPI